MLTDDQKELLVNSALEARKWAYTPYSNYRVGAAVLTSSGRVYDGVNVENAAYPTTICGERVAVFKAVSEGERALEAIAVVTSNGASPCGSCRQVLSEFGPDMIVLIANDQAEIISETTLREMLPGAFGPEKLGVKPD
jgi:cytidine deaminase